MIEDDDVCIQNSGSPDLNKKLSPAFLTPQGKLEDS